MTYQESIEEITNQGEEAVTSGYNSIVATALIVLDGAGNVEYKWTYGVEPLIDAYENCNELSNRDSFAEAVNTVAYTVDPGKSLPIKV